MDDILCAMDNHEVSLLILLDLSAAFDPIDINRLLYILSEEIGITGVALKWFQSSHIN